MTKKEKASKSGTALKTWRYYWQGIKKSKGVGLLILTIITTIIAVFVRAILAPIIFCRFNRKSFTGIVSRRDVKRST